MFTYLSTLPPELRARIYYWCTKEDLDSISLCSRWCHDDVNPILWSNISITWEFLEKTILSPQVLKNLAMTSTLKISSDDEMKHYYEQANESVAWYLCAKFGALMQRVDSTKMKAISIQHRVFAGFLRLLLDTVPNLEILHLDDNLTDEDWECLTRFPALRSLSLESMQIFTPLWLKVCSLENLETLELLYNETYRKINFSKVAAGCFKLVNLRRLVFRSHGESEYSIRPLNDDFLELIGNNCPLLEFVEISDCSRFTDGGLRHLKKLENLREFLCDSDHDYGFSNDELAASGVPLVVY